MFAGQGGDQSRETRLNAFLRSILKRSRRRRRARQRSVCRDE